jgi:hypothetical protein
MRPRSTAVRESAGRKLGLEWEGEGKGAYWNFRPSTWIGESGIVGADTGVWEDGLVWF